MKSVSRRQSMAILSALTSGINWDNIPEYVGVELLKNPAGLAKKVTEFLAKKALDVSLGGLKLRLLPFDPELHLGSDQRLLDHEHDARCDSRNQIDFSKIDLVSGLKAGETLIDGVEKLKRLKKSGKILLGATAFVALWVDYEARKGDSVLEALYHTKKVTKLYFFGDLIGHRLHLMRSVFNIQRLREGDWLDGTTSIENNVFGADVLSPVLAG